MKNAILNNFRSYCIPKNTLLLSKGCFLLLLLKTRSCTEYTDKVVSFNIPVGFNLHWNDCIGKSCIRYRPFKSFDLQ